MSGARPVYATGLSPRTRPSRIPTWRPWSWNRPRSPSTCRSHTHSCSSAHSSRMQRQFRECGIHRFSTAHIRGSRLPRLRRQVPPHGGHLGTTKNAATLKKAVSKAPSGLLYQDLSTLQSDVQTMTAQGQPRTGQGGDHRGRLCGRTVPPVREPFFVIRPQRSAEEHAADLIAAALSPERTSDQSLQPSGPNRSVLSSES